MQQKSSSKVAYVLAALMLSTAIIYFVAAVEESAESAEGEVSEQTTSTVKDRDFDNDEAPSAATSTGAGQDETGGDSLATQVQTAFFAIVGLGYTSIGIWMLKDKGRTNAPYIIAIVGSISIIGLYVASRTIDLPIVGLQDDVGTIDILSKVLQVGIVVLAAYIVNSKKTLMAAPSKRQQTK
jgi:hypothetical protein